MYSMGELNGTNSTNLDIIYYSGISVGSGTNAVAGCESCGIDG